MNPLDLSQQRHILRFFGRRQCPGRVPGLQFGQAERVGVGWQGGVGSAQLFLGVVAGRVRVVGGREHQGRRE